MKKEHKDELLEKIDYLASADPTLSPFAAEDVFINILKPLLIEDGYEVSETAKVSDGGLDFIATRPSTETLASQKLGIEFKYYRSGQAVGTQQVRALVGAAIFNQIDRAILLVNTQFTKAAREILRYELPLQIELIDLDALRAWISRLEFDNEELISEVKQILKVCSQQFALLIAKNPNILEELEWRDIERTIAEIFDGLGFDVTLTPSSKDGGKDVILKCLVQGCCQNYIVEIKHWRSRSRVGGGDLRDFLNVIIRESRDGGLFLSTYGFCDNAFEQLTEIERQRLRFGEQEKIVALSRTYIKAKSGIWSPPEQLTEVLFEDTF
ncbi:restriction endonuclease [Anabaena lutea]|uniref:Restriction endonuclease n=1 Tax=Anabaena lutea FACHB-196 TaxID=2692881 RepID=A0ABR8FD78_9NOST|nr:restriction endonuclease [Anabaena lutea]MBD2567918.1 restriction endonuclease [Anabaena lutea FACHB-196]